MNKGLVIDIQKNKCTILFNGEFINVKKRKGMYEGMTILFTEEDIMSNKSEKNKYWKPIVAVAMAFVLCFFSLSYYNNNISAYSAVTLDINPSIELILNQKDVVIDVVALNEDANKLTSLNLKGLNVELALNKLLSKASAEGFITSKEKSTIVITTVALSKKSEENYTRLSDKLETMVKTDSKFSEVMVAIVTSDETTLKEAIDTKIPLGVLALGKDVDVSKVTTVKELFANEDLLKSIKKLDTKKIKMVEYKDDDDQEEFLELLEMLNDIKNDPEITAFVTKANLGIKSDQLDYDTLEEEGEALLKKHEDLEDLKKAIAKLKLVKNDTNIVEFVVKVEAMMATGLNNKALEEYLDEAEDLLALDEDENEDEDETKEDLKDLLKIIKELKVIKNNGTMTSYIVRAESGISKGNKDLEKLLDEGEELLEAYEDQKDDLEALGEYITKLKLIKDDQAIASFVLRAETALTKNLSAKALEVLLDEAEDLLESDDNDDDLLESDDHDENIKEDLEELLKLIKALKVIKNNGTINAFIVRAESAITKDNKDLDQLIDEAKDLLEDSEEANEELKELTKLISDLKLIKDNKAVSAFVIKAQAALSKELRIKEIEKLLDEGHDLLENDDNKGKDKDDDDDKNDDDDKDDDDKDDDDKDDDDKDDDDKDDDEGDDN